MVIDLITPTPSPIPSPIPSPDPSPILLPAPSPHDTERNNAEHESTVIKEEDKNHKRSSDISTSDEVVEVSGESSGESNKRMCIDASNDGDDDVVLVATRGDLATFTFPHFRYMCGHFAKPFHKCTNAEAAVICRQCYCYPCDMPAKDCPKWSEHCVANATSTFWQAERRRLKSADLNMNTLDLYRGDEILDKVVTRLHDSVKDAPLKKGFELHICQKQTLAWAHAVEINGVNINGEIVARGGIIADEMGMGKTRAMIALMILRPMFTLVVVPPNLVQQWPSEIKKVSDLRVETLYGQAHLPTIQKVERNELDVVIIGAGCKMDSRLWNCVKRLVVDEAHLIMRPNFNSGSVMKYVMDFSRDQALHQNVYHKWIMTGTPWIDYHADYRTIVNRYFSVLRTNRREQLYFSVKTPNDLRAIVMRHTMKQQVRHEDGVVGAALPIPDLTHRQILVELSPSEQRLYEIATCLDHISIHGSLDMQRNNLDKIFNFRLKVANGDMWEFQNSVQSYYSGHILPNVETHAWIEGVHDLLAEIDNLMLCMSDGRMSKFESILKDLKKGIEQDDRFKAVIVTENPSPIGNWLRNFSNFSVVIGDKCHGRIKTKTQHAIEEFQSGDKQIFVCPNHVAEVGVNLQSAKAIYFVDPDFNSTRYAQAVGRIRRAGQMHANLEAVMVVVQGTIHEVICKFHTQEDKNDLELFRQANQDIHVYEELPEVTLEWPLFRAKFNINEDSPDTQWVKGDEFFASETHLGVRREKTEKKTTLSVYDFEIELDDDIFEDELTTRRFTFTLCMSSMPYQIETYTHIVAVVSSYASFEFPVTGLATHSNQIVLTMVMEYTKGTIPSFLSSLRVGESTSPHLIKVYGRNASHSKMGLLQNETFITVKMKQCKCCKHRTLESFKFDIFGPKPFWTLKAMMHMNRLIVKRAFYDSSVLPDPNKTLSDFKKRAIVPAEILHEISNPCKLLMRESNFYYENVCMKDYAKIAIQLPAPTISVGTPVAFQVFDKTFETRVLRSKDSDGIFYKRIPSEDANGQGRLSKSMLLTDDVWELHDKVVIRFPKPDVKLRMRAMKP